MISYDTLLEILDLIIDRLDCGTSDAQAIFDAYVMQNVIPADLTASEIADLILN